MYVNILNLCLHYNQLHIIFYYNSLFHYYANRNIYYHNNFELVLVILCILFSIHIRLEFPLPDDHCKLTFTTSTSFFIFYSSFFYETKNCIRYYICWFCLEWSDRWFYKFLFRISIIIFTQITPLELSSNFEYFLYRNYNILISFSNRMNEKWRNWLISFDLIALPLSGILFYFISIIIVKSRRLERAQGPF